MVIMWPREISAGSVCPQGMCTNTCNSYDIHSTHINIPFGERGYSFTAATIVLRNSINGHFFFLGIWVTGSDPFTETFGFKHIWYWWMSHIRVVFELMWVGGGPRLVHQVKVVHVYMYFSQHCVFHVTIAQ